MIVNPANNSNSIRIPLMRIRGGCFKKVFPTTYPQQLTGIITVNEFQESIENINEKISTKRSMIILIIISAFTLFICFPLGMMILTFRQTSKIRRAIEEESTKYSTRSSKPCRWHLDVHRYYAGMYRGRQRVRAVHFLMIDIGGSAVPTNRTATWPASSINQPNGKFCSQCGTPRENLTAKFCSTCGQAF
ncbi:unnamed protein product [Adineta steineri]|uniref:Uncharacterized protein n=2 Tax=Adineta steineri TaxID=433720 RepID=A0A813S233_9BILA|nr:unnamed protein product [Adineta steineri]CAF1351120.1 unnamed protein product [Adineta steineri]CAF3546463.1 unnamed protein product [Adineta steineri]CAF4166413.1 unnamed protein product [Adineta steineri]